MMSDDKAIKITKLLASPEHLKKNHIDENLIMHFTPMMLEMLADPSQTYCMNVFDQKEKLTFTEIPPDKLPLRKITPEEYASLPEYRKSKKLLWLKAVSDCIVQLILFFISICGVVFFYSSSASDVKKALVVFFSVTAVIFIISYIVCYCGRADSIMSPDELVAAGNVIMFTDEPSSSPDTCTNDYYVGVAFYKEKSFVKKVKCSEYDYNRLDLDSKVIISSQIAYALK